MKEEIRSANIGIESRVRLLDMATFGVRRRLCCGRTALATRSKLNSDKKDGPLEHHSAMLSLLNISERYIRQVLAGGAAQVSAGLSPRGVIALL